MATVTESSLPFLKKVPASNLLWALFVFNCLNLAWFILFRYQKLAFNSDSAAKVLLSKEIWESGSYFPKEWIYANQDIWVFYWHTLIIFLLNFMPAGYAVHAIVSLVGSGLILIGVWLVATLMSTSRHQPILMIATFASGLSLAFTENLFGQVSYGTTVLYYCAMIYLSWRFLKSEAAGKLIHGGFLAALLAVIAWGNPLRGAVFYLAPLLVSYAYFVAQSISDGEPRQKYTDYLWLTLFSAAGFVLGVALHKIVLQYVQMQQGVTQLQWLSLSSIFERIPKIVRSVFFILGGEPHAGRSLYTVSAMYDGFRLIAAVGFLVLVPFSLAAAFKARGLTATKFVAVFGSASFAIISLLMLSTNIYNGRYLLPAVAMLAMVIISQPFTFRANPAIASLRALVIVGFLSNVLVMHTSYWATYHASEVHQDDYQRYDHPYELAKFLESQGLKYGYSTYWTAGVITILTDYKTIVRHIYLENGIPIRFKWLSTAKWYNPSNYQGETFLLLDEDQSKSVNWELLKQRYGLVPSRTLRHDKFIVHVFAENIADKMPGWSGPL